MKRDALRYDGTTGAFIDVFTNPRQTFTAVQRLFAPDGVTDIPAWPISREALGP